jgi:hypothetical protein
MLDDVDENVDKYSIALLNSIMMLYICLNFIFVCFNFIMYSKQYSLWILISCKLRRDGNVQILIGFGWLATWNGDS